MSEKPKRLSAAKAAAAVRKWIDDEEEQSGGEWNEDIELIDDATSDEEDDNVEVEGDETSSDSSDSDDQADDQVRDASSKQVGLRTYTAKNGLAWTSTPKSVHRDGALHITLCIRVVGCRLEENS